MVERLRKTRRHRLLTASTANAPASAVVPVIQKAIVPGTGTADGPAFGAAANGRATRQ
jgi:hypothetical protein